METAVRPYANHRDEGEHLSFLGTSTWMRATGEQTGRLLAVFEQLIPPGVGVPWHLHHNEDESLYVIDGEILFIVGDEQKRISAGPGTYVFGPRGIPHGFRNDGPHQCVCCLNIRRRGSSGSSSRSASRPRPLDWHLLGHRTWTGSSPRRPKSISRFSGRCPSSGWTITTVRYAVRDCCQLEIEAGRRAIQGND